MPRSFFYSPFCALAARIAQKFFSALQRDLRFDFALQQNSTLWSY